MSSSTPPGGTQLRVAYLNTQYPSLSHTFIEREVRAVRSLGVHVDTFSVRPPGRHARLGTANEQAARETYFLLDGFWRFVGCVLAAVFMSPLGFVRALAASQVLSPPGIRARVYHLIYACEGMRLGRELRRRKLNHVHVHMANNGAAVALLACRYRPSISYSLSIHGSAEFHHVDSWRLPHKIAGATFVRCISFYCRAQLMALTDTSLWEKYHIVHCGIDPDVFVPRPPRQPGHLSLLAVGRLQPVKGYHVLIDAMAALRNEGTGVVLEIVGDGPERGVLEERVKTLGLGGCVEFCGAVSQDRIGENYDRADALIISSFMEGVPVVLMEAGAKELAVIATRVGGIPELVVNGESGVLAHAGSAEELVKAIRVLAADPERCRDFGARGRERVLAEYTVGKVGEGMRNLFTRYLDDDSQERHGAQAAAEGRLSPQ
jgi:colanic acid/amylovoran biosynthesis glycosyltransferase